MNKIILLFILTAFFYGCKEEPKQVKKIVNTKKIITDPAGASIIYKDKEIGKTPYTLKAKPNLYTVKLEKQGFRPQYATFEIKKGANPESTYTLEKIKSSVLITSTPSQAYVSMNNKRIGETPYVITDMAFGTHSVKLEKAGFSSKDVSFTIDSERPVKVSTSLESNIGSINITSTPTGARVLLNGKNFGVTPFTREIADGVYKLTIRHANYREINATIAVQKGKKTVRNYKLVQLPCSLKVITQPAGAKIYFDGQYAGTSPVTIKDKTPNVNHRLNISHPGYATQNHVVKIPPGRTETFRYNLKRNNGDLELIINPPGVTVYLDNKKIGVTKTAENPRLSKVLTVKNLSPGVHTIRYTHRRAIPASRTRKVTIIAGEVTRPPKMELWVPNAEIIYHDNSSEMVIIKSQDSKGVFVESPTRIRYTILRSRIKEIKLFKDTE